MNSTQMGLLLLSGMCLVPWILGLVIGITLERRAARLGWPGNLVPDFIRKIIERNSEW